MGLFDKFKKKKKDAKKETEAITPVTTVEEGNFGWDAIEKEFLRIYPDQTNPKHYGTLVKWVFGGKDPLDGISVYDGGDFYHFVTFGLTELYAKESRNTELSGYGYEMTLKLKKEGLEDEEAEIRNVCGILQAVARITFTNGECFFPNEFIYTGQTAGMDANQKSLLTGFIVVSDPSVQTIETPNGRVEFRELVGMTDAELKTLKTHDSVAEIYAKLGSDITDWGRASLVEAPAEATAEAPGEAAKEAPVTAAEETPEE
ncbi:MAG: suppressor of fused domain protein [Lachnospiraceae bacterium]|nr:suppressor of fused domain protein [Lachnospiraceae bacterium]